MYIARHLEEQIRSASKSYPVVMVCGQRQVGKSTMLHHIMEPARKYVTLDDINARRLAENDPGLFFETYGFPLLIDEFQRVPSLLLEIKRIVDERALKGEENSGMFWLTGSQKFSMMNRVSESLAGRVAVFDLAGLSHAEIDGRPTALFSPDLEVLKERVKRAQRRDVHQIYKDIFTGGMPRVVTGKAERERYYMDYVNTYLQKDIRELSQVGKLGAFYDFLVCIAARTAQELRYSDLASLVGVSAPTIKEWVSILESSGVIFILRPWAASITKRLVKTPKIYFMDTGLAAYLCRWPDAATLENGAMDGAFLETYIVTEIIRSYYNAGKTPDLYYYRDIDKREIDLLIVKGLNFYPIEIKKNKNPSNPDINFSILTRLSLNVQPGLVICMSDELVPYNRQAWLCPVWSI